MNDGRLIDLVHSYPHLYDRKRSDFKDTRKKDNSWNEIATLLKYSVVDVQSRWKYLREKYSRERNSDNNLPSGSGAPDKKPWDYLDSLRWLDPYMQKRRFNSVTPTNTRQSSYRSHSNTESNVLLSTFKDMNKEMNTALNVFRERGVADKEDDADLFGRLVASKLRRVTKRKRKEIKKIIFTVLMDGSDSE
ncbi:hypothetical protein RI129_003253 [Pyrocoelia pectoralis]|uniref:MADF domain-containing protein n=1 Tax=Pyrocoelia pectoralis TaxID=417401 RepID=A0AAN7VPV0_9COLE